MWVHVELPEVNVDSQSPYAGHPNFVMRPIGTRYDRAKIIGEMIDAEAQTYVKRSDQLHNVLADAMMQLIAECAATSVGAGEPDAAEVGLALAASIMHGCAINVHLVQMVGDIADLCAAEHKGNEAGL